MGARTNISKKAFYEECARILDVEHSYTRWPYGRITRWNNRAAGNGRFPGYGLVRMFGPHHIQIALRRPTELNLLCHSPEEALAALRTARDLASPAESRQLHQPRLSGQWP
ncbi:hypothetical protein [Sinorhizobium psoraleae]|uniref:Uncharacterized protein n=1 Tax=Sinorhizobium psoraleae TaxID=520838 RepID=A0ABT4KH53_9HYPH|nr:hypothetical protein [Sinorhizobium psoraleae]MCZ4091296.1 hypothetical protein [Sinorhizobium psoraleae]